MDTEYATTITWNRGCNRLCWLAVVALICTSCSKPERGDRIPVYPVRGGVFVGGQPADHAHVVFHSQNSGQRLNPHGRVDQAGDFQLSTYEMNDGAPAGEYVVTFVWRSPPQPGSAPDAPEGRDKLRGRYANPKTSPLHVRIEPGDNKLEPVRIE